MKYYSEVTKKVYGSIKDLDIAEDEYNKQLKAEEIKKKERESKAKRVEEAFKKARDAQKEANTLLSDFIEEYGSYHTTLKDNSIMPYDSLFDMLFKF